ncbi:hypothetical protein [Lutimonas sp.]|jgi:hypothetical protein
MQKLINLIEQVRFAELDKITRMSKAQELYLNKTDQLTKDSAN